MQRIVKYLGIWLAGVLVAALLSDIAGAFFVKKAIADVLMPGLFGYAKKMVFPLEEAHNEKEQKRNAALLGVRALLSDTRFENRTTKFYQNFLFLDLDADQSIIFVGKDGLHDYSSGCYISAYDESSDISNAILLKTMGLVDIAKLVELDSTGELYEAIRENPHAAVRLNAYTIDNYFVTPVSVSLLDAPGENAAELKTITFPVSGDVVHADTIYLNNQYSEENSPDSLYIKMKYARMGQRPAQKAAQKLVPALSVDAEDYSVTHHKLGLMSMTTENLEVQEHCGMISTLCVYYWKGVLLYTCILGAIWAVVLIVIYRKRA